MLPSFTAFILLVFILFPIFCECKRQRCRNVLGSAGYPDPTMWTALNKTIGGRLVNVVPSAKYCASLPGGACTDAQWTNSLFRNTIPGAMNQFNWEQGYDLEPPSLCLRNGTTCGQGDVPLYSVEAETVAVADIQAAVKFASAHNLRLAVKSSGHDYLGRSTAPHSLLIHTVNLQHLSFSNNFCVGPHKLGSAVTVGSGVTLQTLYTKTKAHGKIMVGGTAATVCAAGGYVQGAGHSAVAPLFGLAADNTLEFHLVVASGELIKVNSISHPELFWAMRGGGGGSWGIIVSATFRVYPTFNVTYSTMELLASTNAAAGALAAVHAEHIFDLDSVRGGQYFWLTKISNTSSVLALTTYLKTTTAKGTALLAPFLSAALAIPGVSVLGRQDTYVSINDALYNADDSVGLNMVLGSRLIPAASYRDAPATVGTVYEQLLDADATAILGNLVAGGSSGNANISSAIHPAWRTAKAHVILVNQWSDSTPPTGIDAARNEFQTIQLPILEQMSGPDAGAYSSEADSLEPNYQTTFFVPHYAKLSMIKRFYDPADLFIVADGVGSERWDRWGLCTV
ncbi:FAD-binding domain-containing protein [Mycena epipterygia]|nr:FAD-binding domain-containing protein [Mycena epipterygia]